MGSSTRRIKNSDQASGDLILTGGAEEISCPEIPEKCCPQIRQEKFGCTKVTRRTRSFGYLSMTAFTVANRILGSCMTCVTVPIHKLTTQKAGQRCGEQNSDPALLVHNTEFGTCSPVLLTTERASRTETWRTKSCALLPCLQARRGEQN